LTTDSYPLQDTCKSPTAAGLSSWDKLFFLNSFRQKLTVFFVAGFFQITACFYFVLEKSSTHGLSSHSFVPRALYLDRENTLFRRRAPALNPSGSPYDFSELPDMLFFLTNGLGRLRFELPLRLYDSERNLSLNPAPRVLLSCYLPGFPSRTSRFLSEYDQFHVPFVFLPCHSL